MTVECGLCIAVAHWYVNVISQSIIAYSRASSSAKQITAVKQKY